MTSSLQTEVLFAAFAAVKPRDTLISRGSIESEIETHHSLYPALSGQTSTARKTSISRVMNHLFPSWNGNIRGKSGISAWQIKAEKNVSGQTGGEQ